jgi:prepilin-type N-terminal cleavage/methylation domain-containing protein
VRRAFTLIELLVVVAIIALLISILLPSLAMAKEQARVAVCESNVRQLCIAFNYYMYDYNGYLPGSTLDVDLSGGPNWPPYPLGRKTYDWLGSWWGYGDKTHIPFSGTIYKYVSDQEWIYRCPGDRLTDRERPDIAGLPPWREMPFYSYTCPIILTGAKSALLKRSRWMETWKRGWMWDRDWNQALGLSQSWLLVEEDPAHCLYTNNDGGWTNTDELTRRHRGRATLGHIDGSALVKKFESGNHAFNAQRLYYDLTDGRVVSAFPCGKTMGYLQNEAPALNH